MNSLCKFPISVIGIQEVSMPKDAEILAVQIQGDGIFLLVRVDLANYDKMVKRVIELLVTDQTIDNAPRSYIGTVLVWHVFENLRERLSTAIVDHFQTLAEKDAS